MNAPPPPDHVHAPSYDRAIDLCTATIFAAGSRVEAASSIDPQRRSGIVSVFRELAEALQTLKIGAAP